MLESIYHDRNNTLLLQLEKTLESDFHRYEETREVKSCGVYMVYDNEDKVIYVGKTTRTINKRLGELSSGGHTLHKKLLRNLLGKTLKRPGLKQKDVEELAIRLSLPVGFTRLTKVVIKCSDLSYKIFTPNKGIRLTRLRFRQS